MITPEAVVLTSIVVVIGVGTYRHSRDTAYWRATAEKLGRDHGIIARDDVTARVADHLRWQWLVGLPLVVATPMLLVTLTDGSDAVDFDYLVIAVTCATALLQSAIWSLRSWNTQTSVHRVAHLTRPTFADTFTVTERNLLGLGALFATVVGAWSLTHDGRPVLAGLWLLVIIADTWAGHRALRRVFGRPSNAEDDLELGWDDVLRHIEARGVTGTVVWGPALVAFLLATHRWSADGNLVPFYALSLAAFLICRVFRRGRTTWTGQWNGTPPTA